MEDVDYPGRPLSLPVADNRVDIDLLDAWPIKCAYAVQEIFKTEEDYISALSDIIQGYQVPLSFRLKANNEGHQTISTLFSNVDELYELHKLFLDNLRVHQADPHAFGQVFITAENEFRIYCDYCTNYDRAVVCLQNLTRNDRDIEIFIKACQHNLSHALPLSSQLIKPVQRIMRYHIMLKEVVKHFDRNHHGFHSLELAYAGMVHLGKYVNEEKKRKENADRVEDLQSCMTGWSGKDVKNLSAYGELIIEDTCKIGAKGIERQVILFDKLLLILKKKDAKRYTYKGHILANELHVNNNFSEINETMIKVSSLLHRNQSYVIDVGSTRKQRDWLSKMHDLFHQVVEQAKRGRLLSMPQQQVKRRKIEEENDEFQVRERDRGKPDGPRFSKVSRILSSKRKSHSDVRDLFPREPKDVKLMPYSIGSDVTDSPMQDIPENKETPGKNHPEDVHMQQETVVFEPELNSKPRSQRVSSSNSMDSMLSLNDVDFGLEEHMIRKDMMEEETGIAPREERKSKLLRRSAIKVKRSKTLHLSGSYSNIIKARAREVRAASISPTHPSPQRRVEVDDEEGSSMAEDSGSSNQQSLQMVPISEPIIPETEVSLYGKDDVNGGGDMTSLPLFDTKAGNLGDVITRTSPNKRPRPLSDAISDPAQQQDVLEVEIIHDADGDDIELGESCGQAKLKGRDLMPSNSDVVADGDTGEDNLDLSGANGFLNGSLTSSYLDGSVEEDEEGFMIVEDSSESEDDESVVDEDLDMEGSALESCLLEAAEMGEAVLREEELRTAVEGMRNNDLDNREVPMQENKEPWVPENEGEPGANHVTEFFSKLNTSAEDTGEPFKSTYDSSKNTSPFKFKASRKKHAADVYGTLPHKKKSSSRDLTGEKVSSDYKQQHLSDEAPPSSTRRSEGFFRLLEFTRMQTEIESSSSDLDVTQSLPVLPILDVNDDQNNAEEVSTVKIFSDLSDIHEPESKEDMDITTLRKMEASAELANTHAGHEDMDITNHSLTNGLLDTEVRTPYTSSITDSQNISTKKDASPTTDLPSVHKDDMLESQLEEASPTTDLASVRKDNTLESQLEEASPTTDLASVRKDDELESQQEDTSLTNNLTSVLKEDRLKDIDSIKVHKDELTPYDETINPESEELSISRAPNNDAALGVLAQLSRVLLSRNGFVVVGVAVFASLVYYVWS